MNNAYKLNASIGTCILLTGILALFIEYIAIKVLPPLTIGISLGILYTTFVKSLY
jgi:hypothetical protein